ncbi:leucine-rich repeat-containing protein 15 [Periplaneta americana]|uniref:leucine-rich repeat-containing protein 15 n=1 Tax=Periplaneta americana TaxID=6978 RepID=UPI0037E9AB24
MVLPVVHLLIAIIFGLAPLEVSGTCPYHCLCFLDYTPFTTNCSGLGLDNFPLDVDKKVQWLDLKDNALVTLPNLDRYVALEILELSSNKISTIPANAFRRLTKLKYLDLSNNLFTDWTQVNIRALLQSLIRLKTLKLSQNSLNYFKGRDRSISLESSSLEELHLKACRISEVDGQSLSGLKKLTHLDLSSNPIKWLDDLASPTLKNLDVSFCDIDSMNPNALIKLPSLVSLKLTGNMQFAVNHGNLTSASLQSFDAAYCSLSVPGLYGFPNLTYANLRGNKITYLKDRTFIKNKILVELDLSANEIKDVHPQAFIGSRQLAFVNLSMNSLKGSFPWNTFSTNYNLKTLDLSVNRLESVGNLSILALENLDLSQCQIREIRKDSLTGLPWLMYLNLSRNPLEKIPDDIQSWYLRTLDLSYCRLTTITNDTFKRFPEIVTISLIGNRFTSPFKTYMFEYNDRLGSLKLGDNPWICDCSSQDFKSFWEFLTDYPPKIKQTEQRDIKCLSPESVSGSTWITACYKTWYPYEEPESSSIGLSHYGTALLIMAITVAGIFAVIGAIKHGIKKRLKEEDEEMERERERERRENFETHPRVVFQYRTDFNLDDPESPELRPPRSYERDRGRTDSQLTQPPTYEEAVQMLSASREDVVSREHLSSREDIASASGGGRTQDDSADDGENEASLDLDTGSDSDEEHGAAKPMNNK